MSSILIHGALLGALFACPTFGQERSGITQPLERTRTPNQLIQTVPTQPHSTDSGIYHQLRDGVHWVRGSGYKASFGRNGTSFIPFLGSDAPQLFPVTLSGASLVTSEGAIDSTARTSLPTRDGDVVTYDRGQFLEWYRIENDHIEQLFTFESRPASKSLTLVIPVKTDLVGTPHKGGVRFSNELGGVDYGSAIVFDASGVKAPAPVQWIGDSIHISVSQEFLNQATWPITIDPTIASYVVDPGFSNYSEPDVSYDRTTDRVITVYEESFSFLDHDIKFVVRDTFGAFLHSGYLDFTPFDWRRPKVGNNDSTNLFLMTAEVRNGSTIDVVYQTYDALLEAFGPLQFVSTTPSVNRSMPDVGSEMFTGGASFWMITWVQEDASGSKDIMCSRVSSGGVPMFDEIALTSDSVLDSNPAIANSADTYGQPGNTRFTIVWERGPIGSRSIHGARLGFNGTVFDPNFVIADLPGDLSRPRVSTRLASTTNTSPYLVVYEENQTGGVVDVVGTVMEGASLQFHQNLTDQAGVGLTRKHLQPCVDSDGEQFSVAWSEEDSTGSFSIFVSSYSLLGRNLCVSETEILPFGTVTQIMDVTPTVHAAASSGSMDSKIFISYAVMATTWPYIWGATYQVPPTQCLGRSYCNPAVTNSIGEVGTLKAFGSHFAATNAVTLVARNMPPLQFGYFVVGTGTNSFIPAGSQGRFCVGGELGRYNRTSSEIKYSGNVGTFEHVIDTGSMPVSPTRAIMAGENWYFQAWHRDLNPGQTSNFTRALEIRFD